jgi:hypothetical protein
MPATATIHHPFDRLWRPGHPFRPRHSKGRRWCMSMLLIFIAAVVSSYWYLTDPVRVREMCQTYLSELVGGPVEVGSASLSLLEGLQLKHVVIKADTKPAPDSTLFVADEIEIQYDPASLLRGHLQATKIIATGARVSLVEDAAGGKWNYQRLSRLKTPAQPVPQPKTRPSQPPPAPIVLPQIVLRDARVDYGELQAGKTVNRGSMGIEGRLFLSPDRQQYMFELQSRGAMDGVGPAVTGSVRVTDRQVKATLSNFRFGHDIEAMLPREVRQFWVAHQLEGAVNIPTFVFTPPQPGTKPTFDVLIELSHVRLVILPQEMNPPPTPQAVQFATDWAALTGGWFPPPGKPQVLNPLPVDDVTGGFEFDERGLSLNAVSGTVANNTLTATGRVESYSADAPLHLRIESPPGKNLFLPEKIAFLPSLPRPARDGYAMLQPHGTGRLKMDVVRSRPGIAPSVAGELDIIDGAFDCVFFPYPVRGATGIIAFSPDPSGKFERIDLLNITGGGIGTGPNAGAHVTLTGWAGVGPDPGCHIHAEAQGVTSEPELFAALPPPARNALQMFAAKNGKGYPEFQGGAIVDVVVPPGPHQRPMVSVDLTFTNGYGLLRAFPYPLDGLRGTVNIRDGYLDVHHVTLGRNDATVEVDGRVTWPVDTQPGVEVIASPDLRLTVRSVPVDAALLAVLPPDAADVLRQAHAVGLIDVDGTITAPDHPTADQPVRYDLDARFHDGTLRPRGRAWTATRCTARLKISPERVDFLEMTGRHGDAVIAGSGSVDLATGKPDVRFSFTATGLPLDPSLKDVLPENAQAAWTGLAPVGRVDAELSYHAPPAEKIPATYKVTIHPRDLTMTAAPVPYRLDHVEGTLVIDPDAATLTDIRGKHGNAAVSISGRAMIDHPDDWDLSVKADHVPVDKDLLTAAPPAMRKLIGTLKLKGEIGLDLASLRYRTGAATAAGPDLDLSGILHVAGGSMDAGVPLTDMTGDLRFDAAVRNGEMAALQGTAALDTVSLVDRPIRHFQATLTKPAAQDVLRIDDIRGDVAGGAIDGHVELRFPEDGASGYALHFAVKNADVEEIAKQIAPAGQVVRGQVSASLDLQGDWSSPASRRGRGEVKVAGEKMYQIPLLLGLMEVTNLSLPTSDPFSEGTAGYQVVGNRVTFEQIQMRSKSLLMSGNGWLDFGSKQVRMNFTTANPNLPHVPVISDLVQGARQELLQIRVRGSVQEPKVSAGSFHTFTTTVDEVFSGKDTEQ